MGESLILCEETMSSLQIAEVTNKQHAHIMRDIRTLLEQGVCESNFGLSFKIRELPNGGGKKEPYYQLTKKGCLILASGYNALLREKIINRWEELEKEKRQGGFCIPQSFSEALMLAARQQKELENAHVKNEEQRKRIDYLTSMNEGQQRTIKHLQPGATFAHAVKTSEHSILVGELARIIKQNGVEIGQNRLFAWLREKGYLCKKGEAYNQPTQKAMEMGLFEIKKTVIQKPSGDTFVTTTTKVTGKGQVYFVNKFLYEEMNRRGDEVQKSIEEAKKGGVQ